MASKRPPILCPVCGKRMTADWNMETAANILSRENGQLRQQLADLAWHRPEEVPEEGREIEALWDDGSVGVTTIDPWENWAELTTVSESCAYIRAWRYWHGPEWGAK